jgi:signal transduction histidine kinase
VVLSLVNTALLGRRHGAEMQSSTIDTMRAMVGGVDTELARLTSILQALATDVALDTGDLEGFRVAAARVKDLDPAWATIVLADPSSRQIVNLLRGEGEPLPTAALWPEVLQVVVRERRPVIGPIVPLGPIVREPVLTINVPVIHGTASTYVLIGVVRPAVLQAVITKQRVPADGVVSILDARGQHVVRSRAHEAWVGKPPSEALRALMQRGTEGWGPSVTLEGQPTYAAFSRSPVTGWTVAIGIPREDIDAPVMRSYLTIGGSIVLSLALGLLTALLVARSVTRPVEALRSAAQALGRGERPGVPRTGLPEIREVGETLAAAHTEREGLLAAERHARAEAETTSRAKDEFLAMLSHELRNPLNVIAGGVDTLERLGRPDDAAARTRQLIGRQARHLTALLDDLLDVTRVTSGKIVLHPLPLDLGGTVAGCLAMLENAGRLSRHTVEQALESVWVKADETRMEQVIVNLVANAVKFTPDGGTIWVAVRRDGDEAVLRVEDTGTGIDPELLPRIFDVFVQGDGSAARVAGGLGVGLTLVRRLAELHGGSIGAASDGPGRGATFTLRLPRIAAPVAMIDRGTGPPPAPAPRRVLLVEDNADGRDMLRTMLTLQGHEVHEAADGPSALERALAVSPEVAIIDIGLPGMDGYVVAARLRSDEPGRRLRLIALTGYGTPDDRRRAQEAGFDAHLVKPVDPARLAQALAD